MRRILVPVPRLICRAAVISGRRCRNALEQGEITLKANAASGHELSGIIGLWDKEVGTAVLSLSENVALKAASTMLMIEFKEIGDVRFPSNVTPICVPFDTPWGALNLEVGLDTSRASATKEAVAVGSESASS